MIRSVIKYAISMMIFIKFSCSKKGGQLQFSLGNAPNKNWGSKFENEPYSLSKEIKTTY